jgi:hypothetical protein
MGLPVLFETVPKRLIGGAAAAKPASDMTIKPAIRDIC